MFENYSKMNRAASTSEEQKLTKLEEALVEAQNKVFLTNNISKSNVLINIFQINIQIPTSLIEFGMRSKSRNQIRWITRSSLAYRKFNLIAKRSDLEQEENVLRDKDVVQTTCLT